MPFTSAWMDLKAIIASEKSQTEKSEYCMISLMCVIQKYDKVENIIKKKKVTDIERELMVTSWGRKEEGHYRGRRLRGRK